MDSNKSGPDGQASQTDVIRAAIAKLGLLPSDELVERIDAIVEGGREGLSEESPNFARMSLREAKVLLRSTREALRIARLRNLAAEVDLLVLERLRRDCELRVLADKPSGKAGRDWLLPFCGMLLEELTSVTDEVLGVASRGVPTRAVEFLAVCCQLLDAEVTAETIQNKVKASGGVKALREAMPFKTPLEVEEQRYAQYLKWCASDFARKLFEPLPGPAPRLSASLLDPEIEDRT